MKAKRIITKVLACILVCCLVLAIVPTASVFAQGELQEESLVEEQSKDKGEALQPETSIEDINFKGDLPLEELESAKLADEDIPEIINKGSIEEKGHVNRIREQEDGLNNIAFQNRDGTKTMYCYNYDVKYIDSDGAVRDKSNKISQTPEGDYTNAENDINTIFPKNLNRDNGIELRFGEYVIEMVPDIDIDSAASLSNGSNKYGDQVEYVQYPSIFDKSVSLRYSPTYEGFKEDIVLSEYTGINEFSFRLYTDGLSLVINDEGSYFLIDPLTGETKARIGDLIVYDSKSLENRTVDESLNDVKKYAHRYKVETVKQDSEYLITAVIDSAYLTNSNRVYPVYVDPNICVGGSGTSKAIQDTTVYSYRPEAVCGSNTYNVIGFLEGYGPGRTLMKFPGLSSDSTYVALQSSQITKLSLYVSMSFVSLDNSRIDLWQYTGATWTEATAKCSNIGWNSYTNNFAHNDITGPELCEFNLTNMVPIWKNSSTALDKGILIKNHESETSFNKTKHFFSTDYSVLSERPYISYTYVAPTYTELMLNQSKSGYVQQGLENWYEFNPIQTDYYNIFTLGSTDTYCDLYQDYQGTPLWLESNDDSGDGNNFRITRKLYAGLTYYIRIRGFVPSTSGFYLLRIESDFFNRLQELHDIAKTYVGNNSEAVELTMQFIRRMRYNGSYSDWDKWALAAGDIDSVFVNYVYQADAQLFDYFSISGEFFYYSPQGEKIDIPHLCASYNVYQYDSSGILGNILLIENLIDDLGGWGGDLRSMIPEVLRVASNSTDYTTIYNSTHSLIGNSNTFDMSDLLADTDAFNIYNSINVSSLKTSFENYYYYGGVNNRFTDFINSLSYNNILTTVSTICETSGIINLVWPLYELDDDYGKTEIQISLLPVQQSAIATAFTDYIWAKVQQE